MKRICLAVMAVLIGSAIVAGDTSNESVVIQDLGAALNPTDPTNGGFWSIDWTDDESVRHQHVGITVVRSVSSCSGTFETSALVTSEASDPGPLLLSSPGLSILVR